MAEHVMLRTRFRRWRKQKADEIAFDGVIEALRPRWLKKGYYAVRNYFYPYNVIKISTLGRSYIDQDSILMHGAFQVLSNYVEREWIGSQYHGRIFDLAEEARHLMDTTEEWDAETARVHVIDCLTSLSEQNEHTAEIWHLYVWWKHIRPNRKDPLEDASLPDCEWGVSARDKDGDPVLYARIVSSAEKEAAWDVACKASEEFEAQCEQEDDEMFIRLIKIRRFMWT